METLIDLPRPTKTYHSEAYPRISPENAGFDGNDKTVLVTGGATGVGLSISTAFAEAGVRRIIIISRSPGPQAEAKKAIEAAYPKVEVLPFQASLADSQQIDKIMHEHRPIDVLVLSACAIPPFGPMASMPRAAFAESFEINVLANLDIVQTYLELPAPATGQKTIINVSTGATHVYLPRQIAYAPSKSAFTQIISRLTAEYTPDMGVRMYNYHPGTFYTDGSKASGVPADAFPWEDIKLAGHFAVWLAGSESTFLNGRFVWAQWDVDELIALKDKIEKEPWFLVLGLQQ